MFKLLEATPLAGYRLRLRYADGVTGVVNLSHLVGKGVSELWNDPEAFARVSIGTGGELRWSDAVDLCGDALYLEVTGKLRPRATGLVMEWASQHQDDLRQAWERARNQQPLDRIDPLP